MQARMTRQPKSNKPPTVKTDIRMRDAARAYQRAFGLAWPEAVDLVESGRADVYRAAERMAANPRMLKSDAREQLLTMLSEGSPGTQPRLIPTEPATVER